MSESTDGIYKSSVIALFYPRPSSINGYTYTIQSFVFSLIPKVLIYTPNPLPQHLNRKRQGTHPKISAENMRVTSSHQKNAFDTFAK